MWDFLCDALAKEKMLYEDDLERQLIHWGVWMPLFRVDDIVAMTAHSSPQIYNTLNALHRAGIMTYAEMGASLSRQKRWILTRVGCNLAVSDFGEPLPWQASESGIAKLLSRFVVVEAAGYWIPRLWSMEGLVKTPRIYEIENDWGENTVKFTEDLKLQRVRWLPSGTIDAIAEWEGGIQVPVVWVDRQATGRDLHERWTNRFEGLRDDPEFRLGSEPDPALWLLVCADDAAAEIAKQVFGPRDEPQVIVNFGTRPKSSSLWLRKPSDVVVPTVPRGSILPTGKPPVVLGHPENAISNMKRSAVGGRLYYRVLSVLEDWGPVQFKYLVLLCGSYGKDVARVLRELANDGYAEQALGDWRLTESYQLLVAIRSGVHHNTVLSRYRLSNHWESLTLENQIRHRRVVRLAARFQKDFDVYPGRRIPAFRDAKGPAEPDAWVAGPHGRMPMWYVRSISSDYEKEQRLKAMLKNTLASHTATWVLVFQNAKTEAGYRPMIVNDATLSTTFQAAMRGDLIGSSAVWRSTGGAVDHDGLIAWSR